MASILKMIKSAVGQAKAKADTYSKAAKDLAAVPGKAKDLVGPGGAAKTTSGPFAAAGRLGSASKKSRKERTY